MTESWTFTVTHEDTAREAYKGLQVTWHAIIHELYHLLDFVHPDETEGVVMSEELMNGARNTGNGIGSPTQSTTTGLAKLACT